MTREERVMTAAYVGLSATEAVGAALVLRAPEDPDTPMLNRIVGLGVGAPATEDDVDAALAAMGEDTTFYVAVTPAARPAELPQWLADRGLEPGWGWMAFRRGVDDLPAHPTELELVEVTTSEERAAFAQIVCTGYGLPEGLLERVASVTDHGWECLLALADGEPAGAAGLYADEGAAYLGFAATLPEHRGKGAQGALLARRIARARDLGCDVVLTETGERRDDRPSNSYRNILRAGFEEVGVTANWLHRRRSG